jgi:hypothetical protein
MKHSLTIVLLVAGWLSPPTVEAGPLKAGVAKVEITDRNAGPVSDPSYVKALALSDGDTAAVLITVDAVAIGGIGPIPDSYLPRVRARLRDELGIPPENTIVNASHCHSAVRADTDELTVQAVKEAWQTMTPVKVGAGAGQEDRLSENRRLTLKDGREIDMRRAYALPPDDEVQSVGPIDPQIGVLRLDREDGRPLAVLYNFACHPITGAPGGGNTAGFPGFTSQTIEETLGGGAVAFFVQGCAGDINPIRYKTVSHPPDGEPLGQRLGLNVLRTWRTIEPRTGAGLAVARETIQLPRAADYAARLAALEAQQQKLLRTLQPTDINFKTFLPLLIQHKVWPEQPSYHVQGYLHDQAAGRSALQHHDATLRKQLEAYLQNIAVMEGLTRLNVNQALLRKNQTINEAAGNAPLAAEVVGLRVGDFRLVTFPGELSVKIGLQLKKQAPAPLTFVAGYCNGYLYYLPTEKQRANTGYAQEDCDCLVAPQWQRLFETKALEVLHKL